MTADRQYFHSDAVLNPLIDQWFAGAKGLFGRKKYEPTNYENFIGWVKRTRGNNTPGAPPFSFPPKATPKFIKESAQWTNSGLGN